MDKELLNNKLKAVKLLVMDVDGTMTDGKVYYSKNGEELKCFSIRDGLGIVLLKLSGIEVAILTSENSNIVKARASKLNIDHVVLGSKDKGSDLLILVQKLGIEVSETAFIGDDINDLNALNEAGLSVCPNNAVDQVKQMCDIVCENDGGFGAIRELSEKILISQNKSINLPENW